MFENKIPESIGRLSIRKKKKKKKKKKQKKSVPSVLCLSTLDYHYIWNLPSVSIPFKLNRLHVRKTVMY